LSTKNSNMYQLDLDVRFKNQLAALRRQCCKGWQGNQPMRQIDTLITHQLVKLGLDPPISSYKYWWDPSFQIFMLLTHIGKSDCIFGCE
jgi:hypothetical protein